MGWKLCFDLQCTCIFMGITNSMSEANHRYMLSQLKCFLFEEVGDPNFLMRNTCIPVAKQSMEILVHVHVI